MCRKKKTTFKCKRLNQVSTICLTYLRFLEITWCKHKHISHLQKHSHDRAAPCASGNLLLPFVSLVTVLMIFQTIFIDCEATAETVSTSSVVSDHQDSVVGAFAGAVVLNDSTKVVLPAHSIHNHSQGTLLHQVTHHGLFLTAKGGQQDRLVPTQQNWLCVEATLLSYYRVKCTIKKEGFRIYTRYRKKNGWNSTIQWDSSGTLLLSLHILSVN